MKRLAFSLLLASMALPWARCGWLVTYQVNGTTTCGPQVYPWTTVPAWDNSIQQSPPCEGNPPEVAVMEGTVRPVFTWQTTTGETMPDELHTGVRVDAYTTGWWTGSSPQVSVTSLNWKPAVHHGGSTWGCGATRVKTYPVPANGVVLCDVVALKVTRNTSPDRAAWLRVKAFAAVELWAVGTSTDGTWGQPPPFFSGTNCKAEGHADVHEVLEQGPSCFKRIALYVGNSAPIVETPEFPGDCEGELTAKARFDSTHFPDQGNVQVKVVATDKKGKTYSNTWTGKAWNKGLALGNRDLAHAESTTLVVAAHLRRANHTATASTSMCKDEITSSQILLPLTVFYVTSHGADDPHFQDCVSTVVGVDHSIGAADIGTCLGTSFAPFTKHVFPPAVEEYPQFNFCFIDSCESAGNKLEVPSSQTDAFAGAFGISASASDRCWAGWEQATMDGYRNANWVKGFFRLLKEGNSIIVSAGLASVHMGRPRGITWITPETVGEIEPHFVGDWLTTIHGLYYPSEPLQIGAVRPYDTREWCVKDVQ